MKEKVIDVNGKSYTIKELKYKDTVRVSEMSKPEIAQSLLMSSTGLSEEEFNDLSMSDGVAIMNAINELNGLTETGFQ